ncbi:arginine--tRNA ligase [Cohnella sp.]|uniref:arginine--tRNA ligase n=1 Tax=Cohnella sp. TaxID=1883426 RepID=UPI003567381C
MLKRAAASLIAPYLQLLPEEIILKLEYPPQKEMGDISLPCHTFAKLMKLPPQKIAEQLAEKMSASLTNVGIIATGGYLNLFFKAAKWSCEIISAANSVGYGHSNIGAGHRVIIDMSSPNIAKPFGIGHLRSTMIGNALVNLYRTAGFEVMNVNHLGDWGTQFGKLIVAYKRWGNREALEREPIKESLKLYVRFHNEVDLEPDLENQARIAFVNLERGDPETLELWQYFVDESMKEFYRVYSRLGVTFDYFTGESFYNDKIDAVVERLSKSGILEQSDGARVVRLDDEQLPPCLILKYDGSTIYAVRDIATALYRKQALKADSILYVVGSEQSLHFQQVFSVLGKMGFDWSRNCLHVPFGLMTVDGKKMSTRKGKVIFLEEVLDEAVQRAEQIINEKSPHLANKQEVAEAVGVGAIVFADLKHRRLLPVDFNLEEAVSFDGETGPYLQYTHARICSLLSKGNYDALCSRHEVDGVFLTSESAWECLKTLARYESALQEAVRDNEPFVVARYLLDLAKEFNRFYNSGKIISEFVGEEERCSKLALSAAVSHVLEHGLELLGIKAPREM